MTSTDTARITGQRRAVAALAGLLDLDLPPLIWWIEHGALSAVAPKGAEGHADVVQWYDHLGGTLETDDDFDHLGNRYVRVAADVDGVAVRVTGQIERREQVAS